MKALDNYRDAIHDIRLNINLGDGPFLTTHLGLLMYSAAISLIYLSHLGFLDLSPGIFGGNGVAGLTIAPVEGNVPIYGAQNLLLSTFTASALAIAVSWVGVRYRRDSKLLPLLAGGTYAISMGLAHWLPGVLISTDTGSYSTPPIQYLAIGVGAISVTVLLWVFKRPLLPKQELAAHTLDLYVQNQWRFAQAILSVTVALVVGVSVPFALQYAKTWLFGIGFLILFLIVTPLSVLAFISLRIHRLEKQNREYR